MYKKRKKLISFISEKIEECGIECRIDILNYIAGWYRQEILFFENTGCRIMFESLSKKTLLEIKKMILTDLDKFKIDYRNISIFG